MHAPAARNALRFIGGSTAAAFVVVFVLACTTAPTAPISPSASIPAYDDLLAMAADFSASGNQEVAIELYRHAAETEPARKEPWRHIARLNLAAGRPALALVAAEEALQRDPSDALANEVYISSAMQIARSAMQRLVASGAEPEADELARARQLVETMGVVFGEDALISDEAKARYARRALQRYLDQQAPAAPPRPSPKDERPRDPLDVLGGD